jgi:hypothetical protein
MNQESQGRRNFGMETQAPPGFAGKFSPMSIDLMHSMIGLTFLAVWAMVGQIVVGDRM